MTRGFRNNNPGNLIRSDIPWEGKVPHSESTDPDFEQFYDLSWGIRAMMVDVIGDIQDGVNTIETIISEYAYPYNQNYVDFVSEKTQLNPAVPIPLKAQFFRFLIGAMIAFENGGTTIKASQYEKAFSMLPDSLKEYITYDDRAKPSAKSNNWIWWILGAGAIGGGIYMYRKTRKKRK